MSRVGIFAGTFDPVHSGHVSFALAAVKSGKLDKVYFLPEHQPRGKKATPFKARLTALQTALEPYPKLEVMVLPERRFSVKGTVPKLNQRLDGAQLFFLMGSDAALRLQRWPGIEPLLPEVRLIIGLRTAHTKSDVKKYLAEELPQARAALITSPQPHVSSTKLRQKPVVK